jgi:hypothetical protein
MANFVASAHTSNKKNLRNNNSKFFEASCISIASKGMSEADWTDLFLQLEYEVKEHLASIGILKSEVHWVHSVWLSLQ